MGPQATAPKEETIMKGTIHSLKNATAVRAVAATAVLVPLAAFVGGVKLNHNETFLRDA
jgi:hypothetical protein